MTMFQIYGEPAVISFNPIYHWMALPRTVKSSSSGIGVIMRPVICSFGKITGKE
jgi:hypothetical protein